MEDPVDPEPQGPGSPTRETKAYLSQAKEIGSVSP